MFISIIVLFIFNKIPILIIFQWKGLRSSQPLLLSTFLLHTFVSGLLLSLAIMDYLLALSMCEFHNPRRRRARRGRGKWRRSEGGRGGGEGRGWMRER